MSAPRFVQIATGASGGGEDHDHILYALDEDGRVWMQASKRINGRYERYWTLDDHRTEDELLQVAK